jgi:hypothetical protein
MKKSQISFEFIVLFVFLLFVFVLFASLFPGLINRSSSTQSLSEALANDIKARIITASLSETNFESVMVLPQRINSDKINYSIHADPDNALFIRDEDGRQLARIFLPKINSSVESGPAGTPVKNITIKKDIAINSLTVELKR